MKKLLYIFILACICIGPLFSIEKEDRFDRPILSQYSSSGNPLPSYDSESSLLPSKKKQFPFVSIATVNSNAPLLPIIPMPGIGLSKRKDSTMTDIGFHSILAVNTLYCAKSKIFYRDRSTNGLYCSFGLGGFIGTAVLFPLVGVNIPLRAGLEGEKGFIDAGIVVGGLYVIYPYIMPEVRVGRKF